MRRTIASNVALEGVGLHSGVVGHVRLAPGRAGDGIVFYRDGRRVPARLESVVDARRSIALAGGVGSVEHLLAAAYGLEIDDLDVFLDGPEVPSLDGSAAVFRDALLGAGLTDGPGLRIIALVRTHFELGGERRIALAPGLAEVEIRADYRHLGGPSVSARFPLSGEVLAGAAPARTFGFALELDRLRSAGLIRGGRPGAALVYDGGVAEERIPDELVRHRLLDVTGALALLGARFAGRFDSRAGGHALDVEALRGALAAGALKLEAEG